MDTTFYVINHDKKIAYGFGEWDIEENDNQINEYKKNLMN